MIREEFLQVGTSAVGRHVLHRLQFDAEAIRRGLQGVALFVDHVREGFRFLTEHFLRMLILVKLDDLRSHFVQGLHMLTLDARHLDDVVAEIGFHGADDRIFFSAEHGVFKRFDHHALAEPTEVAPFARGQRIGGIFLCQFGKFRGIGLDLGEHLLGFLLRLVLTVLQVDQDVRRTAFFGSVEAVAVLFIERTDVLFARFHVLKEFRREKRVLHVYFIGERKFRLMRLPISFGFFVRHAEAFLIVRRLDDRRLNRALFREKFRRALQNALRHPGRTGESARQKLTRDVLTHAFHKVLVAVTGAREIVRIEFGRELAVILERRIGLDDFDRRLFGNDYVFLRDFARKRPFVDEAHQHRVARLGAFQHRALKIVAEALAKVVKLTTLHFVELLGRHGRIVDLGDGAVVAHHAVVGIDTGDHKARDDENHRDEHQPALMVAEKLKKHCRSFRTE